MKPAVSLLALICAMMPLPAVAQTLSCRPPQRIAPPRPEGPTAKEPARKTPIGGYTLALSWAPGFCAGRTDPDTAFQCRGDARFGFILHGLWPDGTGRDWPQYCRPVDILPPAVLRENICATPSAQLLQHEWAKHGSCMDRDPDRYFDRARALYAGIRFPDMKRRDLTAAVLAKAIADANPSIPRTAIRIRTDRAGWLQELWLCLNRGLEFTACARQQGGGAPPAKLIRVRR